MTGEEKGLLGCFLIFIMFFVALFLSNILVANIPVLPENLSPEEEIFAREALPAARFQVSGGHPLAAFRNALVVKFRVLAVRPDQDEKTRRWEPETCGQARLATHYVATVRTYTFFGIPLETWDIHCANLSPFAPHPSETR